MNVRVRSHLRGDIAGGEPVCPASEREYNLVLYVPHDPRPGDTAMTVFILCPVCDRKIDA